VHACVDAIEVWELRGNATVTETLQKLDVDNNTGYR